MKKDLRYPVDKCITKHEQYEKDCRQLGDLLLRVDGTARTFCSSIKSTEEIDSDASLQYFDTVDETGESKYRIVFGIVEI